MMSMFQIRRGVCSVCMFRKFLFLFWLWPSCCSMLSVRACRIKFLLFLFLYWSLHLRWQRMSSQIPDSRILWLIPLFWSLVGYWVWEFLLVLRLQFSEHLWLERMLCMPETVDPSFLVRYSCCEQQVLHHLRRGGLLLMMLLSWSLLWVSLSQRGTRPFSNEETHRQVMP